MLDATLRSQCNWSIRLKKKNNNIEFTTSHFSADAHHQSSPDILFNVCKATPALFGLVPKMAEEQGGATRQKCESPTTAKATRTIRSTQKEVPEPVGRNNTFNVS